MIWDQRYASADHVYGTDPNEFLAETIRGFNGGGQSLFRAEGKVHEGRLHTGRGSVVQIVARRP